MTDKKPDYEALKQGLERDLQSFMAIACEYLPCACKTDAIKEVLDKFESLGLPISEGMVTEYLSTEEKDGENETEKGIARVLARLITIDKVINTISTDHRTSLEYEKRLEKESEETCKALFFDGTSGEISDEKLKGILQKAGYVLGDEEE